MLGMSFFSNLSQDDQIFFGDILNNEVFVEVDTFHNPVGLAS
jgi:hypothetical protein